MVAAAAEVVQHLPAVLAEALGHQVEGDFEEGHLAQVEIGGDHLARQARLALLLDLAEPFVEQALDQGELVFRRSISGSSSPPPAALVPLPRAGRIFGRVDDAGHVAR